MPHKRDEIRRFLVESLKNKTPVKDNVFNWRIRPIQNDNELPCISVIIPDETAMEISGAQDLIHRNAEVYIVIYNTVSHKDDNMCDELAKQVEAVLNNLNHKEFLFKYKKMQISTDNQSTKILIQCSLIYECLYFTKECPEINTDNFSQLSIEVSHG